MIREIADYIMLRIVKRFAQPDEIDELLRGDVIAVDLFTIKIPLYVWPSRDELTGEIDGLEIGGIKFTPAFCLQIPDRYLERE